MIPKKNVRNLMLDQEVIEAVKSGSFHIWPVATIEEGIEILTGNSAGEQQAGWFLSGRHHFSKSGRPAEADI